MINLVLLELIPFGDEIEVKGRLTDQALKAFDWLLVEARSEILGDEIKKITLVLKALGFGDGLEESVEAFCQWTKQHQPTTKGGADE